MYICPQKHTQKERGQATHPQTSDVERESDAVCKISAEADHNSLWSIRETGIGDSKNTVSKESIRNTRDQSSRRQLEVLELGGASQET